MGICLPHVRSARPHHVQGAVTFWRCRNTTVCRCLGGEVLSSIIFPVGNGISNLLALKNIFRKKLTYCCCAGSLDGETEILFLDSLSAHSASWGAANSQFHNGGFFVSCDTHTDKTILAEEPSAVPLELV